MISQVYGAGGETDADFNADYVELFNPTDDPIDLTGWSLQYADSGSGTWDVFPLAGTLDPGHYYLLGSTAGVNGQALPTPDQSSTLDAAAADGKVALVNTTDPLLGEQSPCDDVVDLVGYGIDADWFEGTGPAGETTPNTATLRLGHGNFDTDDNVWDFTTGDPTPRNSGFATANRKPNVEMPTEVGTPLDTPVTLDGIAVADPDAGEAPVELTVSGYEGTVTLSNTSGLTFSDGDGTADPSMTFTGSLSAANDALAGLTSSQLLATADRRT